MERIEAMRKLIYFVSLVILLAAALTACQAKPVYPEIILATTTSTQDSGLLDALVPMFEQESGYTVKTVAVGTGQALKMGEEGNADILLVHSPKAEEAFMQAGFGLERHLIMHNDFVLAGPAADPAGIRNAASTTQALIQIANAAAPFVSRGDDSGTHKMERSLWEAAGSPPLGGWYIESGQGMGATLRIASEKQAYTLTDRATYLANRATLQLEVLLEGDPSLLNIYHVIVVNPEKWPQVNLSGARAFAEFLLAPETQALIGQFGVSEYGQPLFFPDAGKSETDLGLP